MELIENRQRFREACEEARREGAVVGFVPTMGDLHAGHQSLIRRAREECGFVAVSVFVNPLQFDSKADLAAYPRVLDQDRQLAEALGCDVVFAPSEAELYRGGGPEVSVDPGPLGGVFEGAARPGHFRGVLTVVAKLFGLAGPCRAYFGEKDAQQVELVRRMVGDLESPVEVHPCPTVRDPDGLAISSRNARLSEDERRAAPVLFEALSDAATMARQGERGADILRAAMARTIGGEPLARLDYVAIVDEPTWREVDVLERPARALVAARFGTTRLIDNLVDVGNTATVVGVFQGDHLERHWRMATHQERTADELALLFGGFLEHEGLSFSNQITGVAIASVVPDQTQALREMVQEYFHFAPVVVEPGVKTGIPILTDNPREVGADRIVNAVAAFATHGGPCIVVDFGTATTYDAVSERGEYLGGVIAPGVQISAGALFASTARLPRVELAAPRSAIGRNTVESIQSGLVYGTAAEVDGIVERLQKELGGHAVVVATGGLAGALVPFCASVDHHEPWLTLEGLHLIFERNTARDD
jgi:type III pantothenate kinase